MEKRSHKYRLQLDYLTANNGEKQQTDPVQIEFENHDNILAIIEILKEKDPFENKDQAVEFAIGLKMFSEIMIKNRNNPLFEELMPTFGVFMKKLKSL
ncbi:DUF3861 domain-containing protein [Dyadobacter sp. LHD-138]|uniref:DUF3861 domain-containing protein n=1 Tax=Dyadobacter sp. LHD-138 TaxID=3071413 RepID=UPI0027E1344A|nr:DUF3861 domain-containing protein [Dyadobacter sp. LHD-138]MDQ6478230.1 DUF3861 domain-containing protein [Dyadobacter sp. LHD-138]